MSTVLASVLSQNVIEGTDLHLKISVRNPGLWPGLVTLRGCFVFVLNFLQLKVPFDLCQKKKKKD
jgi:hypothetical protein